MVLLSDKCIMPAMAVLLFLWMVAPWQQVNAQASLEQNQRHQLSIASISSMDFYKPDHSSQFQNRAGWQQPPLPVNTNNHKRPRFKVPGRSKQPTARPRNSPPRPVQKTSQPRYSSYYDNTEIEERQESNEPKDHDTFEELKDDEEVTAGVSRTHEDSFKLVKTFDEDGVHVPLSILRAFQKPKTVAHPPRSAKSITNSGAKDQLPINDQAKFAIHSNTQLEYELTSDNQQAVPEASHHQQQQSGARNRLTPVSKPADSHSGSYGLTAASVYARSQPSLRRLNQEPREVERPRPYRQRPISSSTVVRRKAKDSTSQQIDTRAKTESESQNSDQPNTKSSLSTTSKSPRNKEIADDQLDSSEDVVEEQMEETKQKPFQAVNIITKSSPPLESTPVDIKSLLRNTGSQSLSEILQQKGMKLSDLLKEDRTLSPIQSNSESTTIIPTTIASPSEDAPTDIKSLLKNAGSQSLSEILQHKGMKLSDLLKGGRTLESIKSTLQSTTTSTTTSPPPEAAPIDIKSLLRNAGSQSLSEILQQKGMKLSDILKGGQTLASIKATTTSKPPLRPIPSAQPISIKELFASANVSLKDFVTKKPSTSSDKQTTPTPKPISVQDSPNIKPGVKRPRPFVPGRSKQFSLPPSTTPSIDIIEKNTSVSSTPPPTIYKDTSHLEPLVFGENFDESTTTRSRTSSPRPYIVGNNVGEYGVHIISEDDDDKDNPIAASNNVVRYGTYNNHGNRRPIATSRLTPAPPRSVKKRPVFIYNYSAISEEDYGDSEETVETTPLILTHFNEEEMREEETPYFNLPLSVRNALTFSFYIGGFSLLVFLVIFVLFKVQQKSRIRLRYPLALLANTKNNSTTDVRGSDVSTPNPKPKRVSTYAKLPQRSNSLWGTLRRSVKQMENI